MLHYSIVHSPVPLVVMKSFLWKLYTRHSWESQEMAVIVERYGGEKKNIKFVRQLLVKTTNTEVHEIPLRGLGDKTC